MATGTSWWAHSTCSRLLEETGQQYKCSVRHFRAPRHWSHRHSTSFGVLTRAPTFCSGTGIGEGWELTFLPRRKTRFCIVFTVAFGKGLSHSHRSLAGKGPGTRSAASYTKSSHSCSSHPACTWLANYVVKQGKNSRIIGTKSCFWIQE
jgi:hypothetical protein